jgi:hypothetical protein
MRLSVYVFDILFGAASELTLALLVARILLVDDVQLSFATYNFAVCATLFY